MNRKQFEALIARETAKGTDRYLIGDMHRAWHDYRYATDWSLHAKPITTSIACALIVWGFVTLNFGEMYLGQTLASVETITYFVTGLLLYLYAARSNCIWKGEQLAEFRATDPRAHLIFPTKQP